MLMPTEKNYRTAAHILLAIVAVLIIITFRQYGVTWDEELQSQYGLAVVDYYLSLFQDHRYADIFNLYLYGGMFDGVASIFDRFTPFSLYETRHLVNALFGLLGLWGVWRLGRSIGGGAVGLLSLIMLALTPMYYGMMFNNPKDIPFAAGIIWSLYYMGRCFTLGTNLPRRLPVKLGIILGLTLGVRVGGVMLPAFWMAALGADVVRFYCQKDGDAPLPPLREGQGVGRGVSYSSQSLDFLSQASTPALAVNAESTPNPSRKGGRGALVARYALNLMLRLVLPVALISYAVMLLCWPWAQQNPIINPLRALSEFSNFPQDVEVLLDGTTYRSTQLPWYYVPLYFGVQLPEFILVLLGATLFCLPRWWRLLDWPRRQLLITMLLMGLFPITYAMLRHPALYDAVRHFLFVTALAAVLCAMTAHYLFLMAARCCGTMRLRQVVAGGLLILGIAVGALQITIMVRLHPYEYIFANQFAGGVTGAFGRYELDYWGSSFKEAAEKLQKFVAHEGGVPGGKIYKIAICGPWSSAMMYLPPDYEPVIANAPAEFFLATTRWMCPNMRPGKEIIEISRIGAPLAVIKDLRGGYEHYEGNEGN